MIGETGRGVAGRGSCPIPRGTVLGAREGRRRQLGKKESRSEFAFPADRHRGVFLLGELSRLSTQLVRLPAFLRVFGPCRLEHGHPLGARRHPLLAARVQMKKLAWRSGDDLDPAIRWERGTIGGPLPPAGHQDLEREMGVRFHVRTDTTNSELTIQFHHACCDGIGGCQFIGDLLLGYAAARGAPGTAEPAPLDFGRLGGRARSGMTPQLLAGLAHTHAS